MTAFGAMQPEPIVPAASPKSHVYTSAGRSPMPDTDFHCRHALQQAAQIGIIGGFGTDDRVFYGEERAVVHEDGEHVDIDVILAFDVDVERERHARDIDETLEARRHALRPW